MKTVISKFHVTNIESQGYSLEGVPTETGFKINMSPVYRPKDPANENHKFWQASPSGALWLQIQNLDTKDFFKIGGEQYVLFVDAGKGKDGLIEALEAMVASLKAQTETTE